jgi:integrase
MLFRVVRPMKRKGSRNGYFVQRIPADLKAKLTGERLEIPLGDGVKFFTVTAQAQMVCFSLLTADPSEIKSRQAIAAAYLEGVWEAYRKDAPASLAHPQAVALAGDLYRSWADGGKRSRTTAMVHMPGIGWVPDDESQAEMNAHWEAVNEMWMRVGASGDPETLEEPLGPLVNRLLRAKGIHRVTAQTRSILLSAFWAALRDAFESRQRNAEGDYSPDVKANRFPEWQHADKPRATDGAAVSLKGLVDGWWIEAKALGRKPSTHESYSNTMAGFVAYLGHDDAGRVTKAQVIGFKEHRLATLTRFGRNVTPKTVKDSDLAGLKAVFGWAKANLKMASNPAEGVTLKLGKKRKLRSKGFTDAEAVLILSAALHHQRGKEQPGTYAAKRWIPFVMAYTGARVGELAQLRSQDLRHEGGQWIIRITPEAGTVKTDQARDVVLHPHLVELGFVEFVKGVRPGHLFLRLAEDGDVLGPLQGLKNRLAEFAREVISDVNVAPNHGWRHAFKTRAINVGIDPRIRDAIQGHSPRTEGEDYGDVTIEAQAAAIAKMPRYAVT